MEQSIWRFMGYAVFHPWIGIWCSVSCWILLCIHDACSWCTPLMVWFSIFATIGIFFFAAWYAGDTASKWKAADPQTYTDDEIKVATIASYVMYAVGGLLVLLFLFMRKRIQLAMGCVKETSKAVMKMPLIILFPVLQGLGFMIFMIAWTVYAANLASMGDFSTKTFEAGNIQISVSK